MVRRDTQKRLCPLRTVRSRWKLRIRTRRPAQDHEDEDDKVTRSLRIPEKTRRPLMAHSFTQTILQQGGVVTQVSPSEEQAHRSPGQCAESWACGTGCSYVCSWQFFIFFLGGKDLPVFPPHPRHQLCPQVCRHNTKAPREGRVHGCRGQGGANQIYLWTAKWKLLMVFWAEKYSSSTA